MGCEKGVAQKKIAHICAKMAVAQKKIAHICAKMAVAQSHNGTFAQFLIKSSRKNFSQISYPLVALSLKEMIEAVFTTIICRLNICKIILLNFLEKSPLNCDL